MPLQFEVADLADVPEAHRDHYTQTEAGRYRLQVAGLATVEQLREGLRAETAGRRAALAEIDRLEKLTAARAEIQRLEKPEPPSPIAEPEQSDDARLEAETARKLAAHVADREAHIAGLRRDRDTTALARVAHELAGKLAGPDYAALLAPHIAARLVASDAGGRFEVTAKDLPTLEHLAAELRADPKFARVIIGASPADQALHQKRVNETLGVTAARPTLTRAKFDTLRPAERAAHVRAGAEIFDTTEIAK
jgi:hypothetical protein